MIGMKIDDRLNEIFNKPKLIDFQMMFSQLHLILDSGTTLQHALKEVAQYVENNKLKSALLNVSNNLGAGISTGAAFRKESVFPMIVAPTIEAGDRAGELSKSMQKLSEIFKLQHNLYTKVNNALFVPKLAAFIMALMTVAYIKIAIPEFLKLYEESNVEVPGIVSVVSNFVNLIVDNWYITVFIIFLLIKSWQIFAVKNTYIIDGWKLKVPIFKKLHFHFLQHQYASIISLMIGSGLTVPDALVQAGKVVSNSLMAEDIKRVYADVVRGHTLTSSMKRNNVNATFDGLLITSVYAGENSNQLVLALDEACKYYENTLKDSIEPTSTKITLLVLIPMGILVVAMYIFTMIPMFSYMSQLQ